MSKEKQLKCYWCKILDSKVNLKCDEKSTGKLNKDGSLRMSRRYLHSECEVELNHDKEMKQKEVEQWNELYEAVKKIHNIELLDTRMIKKLQDLRNGTLTVNGKQLIKNKQGIQYQIIQKAYHLESEKIAYWQRNKTFETKYNEFAYCFSIMEKGINDVIEKELKLHKHNEKQKRLTENLDRSDEGKFRYDAAPTTSIKRKDELDLSDIL